MPLHLIGGEKGGVGKSFTARLLAQYFIDSNREFIGFDSDQSHQTFSRFYSDFTSPIKVDDYESLDTIISAVEESTEREIIVDLAAQTADRLFLWLEDTELFSLMEEMGIKTYYWHIMDDGADSVHLLGSQLRKFGRQPVQFVVVMNQGRGDDFKPFAMSDTYENAGTRGAKFMELARLQPALAKKLDFRNSSFWAAANSTDGLTTAERQRARVWLKWQYAKLDMVLLQNDKEVDDTILEVGDRFLSNA